MISLIFTRIYRLTNKLLPYNLMFPYEVIIPQSEFFYSKSSHVSPPFSPFSVKDGFTVFYIVGN